MNSSDYITLQNKRWRSITYNWEILSTYGNGARLYCLTDIQAGWLLSNTEYMRWTTRWENCPCTQSDLDAMKAELDYNLMNCIDFDPYQIGYMYNQAVQTNLDELQAAYDVGGVSGVNPDTPTDYYSGNGSSDALNALCMAVDAYVKSYLDNWLRTARQLLGLTFLLGLAVVINPLTGIIAALVIGGLAFVTQTAIDAVTDQSAVDDVICCMYNSLIDQDMTQENFENSLDGCVFEVGSNAAIVRDLVASDLDKEKNWISFFNQIGKSTVLMESGVDYQCPCEPLNTWCIRYNFDNPDGVPTVYCGANSGESLLSDDVICNGGYFASITFDIDEFTMTKITARFSLIGNTTAFRERLDVFGPSGTITSQDINPASAGVEDLTYTNLSGVQVDRMRIEARNGTIPNPPTADSAQIVYIEIEGIGANPFVNSFDCP